MISTKHKSAAIIFPIVFLSLVLTGCQKTQDEVSHESTETVEVYNRDNLPSELQELANQGDAEAQISLGWMYLNGESVSQDYFKAAEWYEKAANQGLVEAQYNIGVMHTNGTGVSQDYAKAKQWFEKAANQGVAQAQFNLGVMYANGTGVRQDDTKAIELFQNACDKGVQEGCDGSRLLN